MTIITQTLLASYTEPKVMVTLAGRDK